MTTSTIGFIGGTGPEGRGLALRFALAGLKVMIGSRDAERANEAVAKIADKAPPGSITGALNDTVAAESDVVFIAVPYAGQRPTLESLGARLTGKLVVTVVAPVTFDGGVASALPVPEGSAALQAASLLPNARVAAAFHNVAARDLLRPDASVNSDVFVFSDDEQATAEVSELTALIPGARAVNGGGLVNSRYAEDLTALLMNINRIHKAHTSIRITGL
jgi:NADPH-dependent F420 reductase